MAWPRATQQVRDLLAETISHDREVRQPRFSCGRRNPWVTGSIAIARSHVQECRAEDQRNRRLSPRAVTRLEAEQVGAPLAVLHAEPGGVALQNRALGDVAGEE